MDGYQTSGWDNNPPFEIDHIISGMYDCCELVSRCRELTIVPYILETYTDIQLEAIRLFDDEGLRYGEDYMLKTY